MKIENGKIVEATTSELFSKWLDEDWCEIMSFPEFLDKVEKLGTKVTEESSESLQ